MFRQYRVERMVSYHWMAQTKLWWQFKWRGIDKTCPSYAYKFWTGDCYCDTEQEAKATLTIFRAVREKWLR